MDRTRRALVKGRRARFWLYDDGYLVLPHPTVSGEFTEVPLAHLADAGRMQEHYARLAAKAWVTRRAIDELERIAEGSRA